MKAVAIFLALMVATVWADPDKRFLTDTFKKIKEKIQSAFNAAKNEFNHLTGGIHIDFHAVLNKLAPYIVSNKSTSFCIAKCNQAAEHILGSAASLSHKLCPPACRAVLAELQSVAG